MSKGAYQSIYTALIDDPKFQSLSKNAKLLLLILRLQRSIPKLFRVYWGMIAEQTGLNEKELSEARNILIKENYIKCEGVFCWVVNGLKHDPAKPLLDKKKKIGVINKLLELPQIEETKIFSEFINYYALKENLEEIRNKGLGSPCQGASQGHVFEVYIVIVISIVIVKEKKTNKEVNNKDVVKILNKGYKKVSFKEFDVINAKKWMLWSKKNFPTVKLDFWKFAKDIHDLRVLDKIDENDIVEIQNYLESGESNNGFSWSDQIQTPGKLRKKSKNTDQKFYAMILHTIKRKKGNINEKRGREIAKGTRMYG